MPANCRLPIHVRQDRTWFNQGTLWTKVFRHDRTSHIHTLLVVSVLWLLGSHSFYTRPFLLPPSRKKQTPVIEKASATFSIFIWGELLWEEFQLTRSMHTHGLSSVGGRRAHSRKHHVSSGSFKSLFEAFQISPLSHYLKKTLSTHTNATSWLQTRPSGLTDAIWWGATCAPERHKRAFSKTPKMTCASRNPHLQLGIWIRLNTKIERSTKKQQQLANLNPD